ncbi:MAG: GntP family permease [Bacteroidota bacterium]
MLFTLSILIIFLFLLIISISIWKIHPFIALILTAMGLGLSMGLGGPQTVDVLLKGFSETLRWVAVIIILGAFIGEVLQESGGAVRLAQYVVKQVGEKKLPWAMGITGYMVSIPVFVDVAYILLQPVTESLAVKSKKPVLYIGLSLAAGLTVAHTLIPPTPGPLAVASLLQLDLGRMLWINLTVGAFAMIGGVCWVIFSVKNSWLEYDQKLSLSISSDQGQSEETSPTKSVSFLGALLPILIPILLIGLGAFMEVEEGSIWARLLNFFSLPMVAVLVGALISIFQLPATNKKGTINRLVEQAILKSALVIMITGAGGSLGFMIKETGVQNDIVALFSGFPFLGMMLPFVVAALLTTATGSITVSLVGTASMIGPMVDSFPISPEIVAAMIGCGSFCVFHANASFFWLLNRLHEVPPNILYKTYTLQSLIMGISGLVGVLLLSLFGG